MHDDLQKVILGHLSKENNYPELALETVRLEMGLSGTIQMSLFESDHSEEGLSAEDVVVAPRDTVSGLITL